LLAFGLPLRFVEISNWRDRLRGAWSTMLPEAEALIRVDSEHLTVGATAMPWGDVRLEAVESRPALDLWLTRNVHKRSAN
jgi:hypothetical protein